MKDPLMKPKMMRMFEYLSAMQKSIRRGLEEEAGYWFFALAEDGFVGAALNRLLITAHEDIGINDVQAVMYALRCIDDARFLYKSQNDGWRLPAVNAVLVLSRAKKGREADNFQAVCRGRLLTGERKEIPDWALDKHTIRGRRMGRGFEHFFEEGVKLMPEHHDEYEKEAIEYFKSGVLDRKNNNEEIGEGKKDRAELF